MSVRIRSWKCSWKWSWRSSRPLRCMVGAVAAGALVGGVVVAASGPAGASGGSVTLYVVQTGTGSTCTTSSPCGAVRTAVTRAVGTHPSDAVTITVGAGTYDEWGIYVTARALASLDIHGQGPGSTFIDGGTHGGVLVVTGGTVDVSGLTIEHGRAGNGGGLYITDGTVTVTDVSFSSDASTADGGGLYDTVGTVRLSDVTFSTDASTHGGGCFFSTGSSGTLTGVTFSNDRATGNGGGLYKGTGSLTVTRSTFSTDSTTGDGGGLFKATSGTVTLAEDTFSTDHAYRGGGVFNSTGATASLTAASSSFTGDRAYEGGGLFNSTGTASLTGVRFTGDEAYDGGGFFNYGTADLSGVSLTADSATYGGGFFSTDGTANLTTVTFTSDHATAFGGGFFMWTGSVRLRGVTGANDSASAGPDYYNTRFGTGTVTGTVSAPVVTTGTPGAAAPSPAVTPPKGAATTVVRGTFSGDLDVKARSSVFLAGGTVTGNVIVPKGSSFAATGGVVHGSVISTGGVVSLTGTHVLGSVSILHDGASTGRREAFTHVCAASIGGNLVFEQATAPADLGGTQGCRGSTIKGSLVVENDAAPISVQRNVVGGDINVFGDAGGVLVGNHAGGSCSLGPDRPRVTGRGNTAKGTNGCNAAR